MISWRIILHFVLTFIYLSICRCGQKTCAGLGNCATKSDNRKRKIPNATQKQPKKTRKFGKYMQQILEVKFAKRMRSKV